MNTKALRAYLKGTTVYATDSTILLPTAVLVNVKGYTKYATHTDERNLIPRYCKMVEKMEYPTLLTPTKNLKEVNNKDNPLFARVFTYEEKECLLNLALTNLFEASWEYLSLYTWELSRDETCVKVSKDGSVRAYLMVMRKNV